MGAVCATPTNLKRKAITYADNDIKRVLHTEEEIQMRLLQMANKLEEDYEGKDLFLVGILHGAFMTLSDLAKKLNINHIVDFIKISSYHGTTQDDSVRFHLDLTEDIRDKHVVIVEDCIDSGKTLTYAKKFLLESGAADVKVLVMFDKQVKRDPAIIKPDYIGFEVPDVWIVGYGLDTDGYMRTLPFLGEIAKHARPSQMNLLE